MKKESLLLIRSDHDGESENHEFETFMKNGIEHELLAPMTPQQNGVVERRNTSFQKIARTMLN